MYSSASAHPVTLGVTDDGERHHGGDGRTVGYLSGACRQPDSAVWRERHHGKVPMTRLWLRLDPEQLAKLPGVREAALEASPVVPVPPCPTCKGSPRRGQIESEDLAPFAAWKTCPSCNGSGRDRLIPESAIAAILARERVQHPMSRTIEGQAVNDTLYRVEERVTEWLDERGE